MQKVLVVCTGNTCRSVMAEAVFNHLAQEQGIAVEVESAGIGAMPGDAPTYQAEQVMKERGLDVSQHRSRRVRPEMLTQYDLILTMTASQKQQILASVPELHGKVYQLLEWAEDDQELASQVARLDELNQGIRQKLEQARADNAPRLAELHRRHNELFTEIDQIEQEIQEIEQKLNETIREEQAEAKAIHQKLASWDVSDPFGQPIERYRATAQEIEDAIARILRKWR